MSIVFKVRTDIITDEDGDTYTAYGIDAFDTSAEVPKLTDTVSNIFLEYKKTAELAEFCNNHNFNVQQLTEYAEYILDR